MSESSETRGDNFMRVNVRIEASTNPELFAALSACSDRGRAERFRSLATAYLQLITNGISVGHAPAEFEAKSVSADEKLGAARSAFLSGDFQRRD